MEFRYLLQQFVTLLLNELDIFDVFYVCSMLSTVVIAEVWLYSVGAKHALCNKWTWQPEEVNIDETIDIIIKVSISMDATDDSTVIHTSSENNRLEVFGG